MLIKEKLCLLIKSKVTIYYFFMICLFFSDNIELLRTLQIFNQIFYRAFNSNIMLVIFTFHNERLKVQFKKGLCQHILRYSHYSLCQDTFYPSRIFLVILVYCRVAVQRQFQSGKTEKRKGFTQVHSLPFFFVIKNNPIMNDYFVLMFETYLY